MNRIVAIVTTVGLLWLGGAAIASPMNPPVVETLDCSRGVAVVAVSVDEGHYVIISDGDGYAVRIDGPATRTVELATGTYRWSGFGVDSVGQAWNKGEGSFVTENCVPVETTSTTSVERETTTVPVESSSTSSTTTSPTAPEATTTTAVPAASTPSTSGPTVFGSNGTPTPAAPTSITTIPVVTASTLPFTGPERGDLAMLAFAGTMAMVVGLALVAGGTRRSVPDTPH